MSDDLLPKDQRYELYKVTTITEELLVKCIDSQMIPAGENERIVSKSFLYKKYFWRNGINPYL